jgi:hypothetical protein
MKYNLVGVDGNAFSIMGYVINAMKKEKRSTEEQKSYQKRAMSGNYDNLLFESVKIIDELNKE